MSFRDRACILVNCVVFFCNIYNVKSGRNRDCVTLLQGGQVWLKDKEASHCKLCEKEFSISRRKVSSQMIKIRKRTMKQLICTYKPNTTLRFYFFCLSLSSTTAGTVGRFSVTTALTMSSLCLPHQNQSESVTPATPSSSNGAPPIQHEGATQCCHDCFKQSEHRFVNRHPPVLCKIHLNFSQQCLLLQMDHVHEPLVQLILVWFCFEKPSQINEGYLHLCDMALFNVTLFFVNALQYKTFKHFTLKSNTWEKAINPPCHGSKWRTENP